MGWILSLFFVVCTLCGGQDEAGTAAKAWIAKHGQTIQRLEVAANRAWWDANVSGSERDFAAKEKAQNALDRLLSDKKVFEELKSARKQLADSRDVALVRELGVFHRMLLAKQVPEALLKKISAVENAVEKTFNTFRAKLGAQELSGNGVNKVLRESVDSAYRKQVWEASKEVGALVEKDLRQVVALRNEAAKKLGFKNFHSMQLELSEQSPEQVLALFDELDRLTRKPFQALKAEMDVLLARVVGIEPKDLMPWHYQDPFFQDAPSVFEADLDSAYAKADVVKLTADFYEGIGLPVAAVIAKSDLFEKKGKSPHAFCIDIDREGDVRVLANVVPSERWMSTMLHEMGHAVYSSRFIPDALPYRLRSDAHILATEGVGMLFQKFSKSAEWLRLMGVKVAKPEVFERAGRKMNRADLLVFSRWAQVMFRFEKALYEDPSRDLNRLWWKLVEKYQGLRAPQGRNAPDYASKIHIVVAPAYYHNYLLGQLFASQVHHAVAREVLGEADPKTAQYVGNPKVGAFFKDRIFSKGALLSWDALTEHATGSKLSPKAFALDLEE